MTVSFQTLGCKLNQYETDSLAADFLAAGWDVREFGQPVDVAVINTCTVTNRADRKSRNIIGKAERTVTGAHLVIVTGCFAENAREELEGREGVSYVVDNQRKSQIFALVESHFRGEMPKPETLHTDLFSYTPAENLFHTRSTVKVQDGCDNFCTFCIIPFVRGAGTSRPLPQVVENVRQLLAKGYKEIVLTGVNITRYLWEGKTFEDLVENLLALEGDWRLRISSVEPENLGPRFLALVNHPRMCPNLHLCLQSGSDKVLLGMRRTYTLEDYAQIAEALRARRPDFNLTTDMITGFPGETEEDHEASAQALRRFRFGHVHVFPYSRRTGTRADRMDGQLGDKMKDHRARDLEALGAEIKRDYRQSLVGKTQRVLVERVVGDLAYGHGEHYVPVEFSLPGVRRNDFVSVKLLSVGPGDDPVFLGSPLV